MSDFNGKVAIVTGGASGIGASIVSALRRQGATVIVADLRNADDSAASTAAAHFVAHDVTSDASWQGLLASVSESVGPLDILVNCAGVMTPADIENTSLDLFEKIMAVNATGTFLGCKHALAVLRTRPRGGSIVNIASTTAIKADTSVVAYSASKATVVSLTRSTALHCAKAGYPIRCNAVLPGVVMTPMLQSLIDASPDRAAALQALSAVNPIGRLLSPDEVAAVVLFVASDAASGMTGSAVVVDGGLTAG